MEGVERIMTQCKNKHTGEIAEYLRSENVKIYLNSVRVHILFIDGKEERWNDHFFDACWEFLPKPKS
jgi:hypothetical protein